MTFLARTGFRRQVYRSKRRTPVWGGHSCPPLLKLIFVSGCGFQHFVSRSGRSIRVADATRISPRQTRRTRVSAPHVLASLNIEACWRKWRDIVLRTGACDYLCHCVRSNGREQDSIPKMPGCDEIAWSSSDTEDGQIIGRTWPQTCPSFQHPSPAEGRNQIDSRMVQALDHVHVGALVVARFFNRGSDQNAAIATRNQIHFGCTNYVAH